VLVPEKGNSDNLISKKKKLMLINSYLMFYLKYQIEGKRNSIKKEKKRKRIRKKQLTLIV
jgi:hypothetical protein